MDHIISPPSASIPKSTPYFLEKSVTFGSIQKSNFMNLLWNHSTSIVIPGLALLVQNNILKDFYDLRVILFNPMTFETGEVSIRALRKSSGI
jgi:hypothetical protein